jgi:hypothetical protein
MVGFVGGAKLCEDDERWREIRAARFDVTLDLAVVVWEDERKGEVEVEKDEEGGLLILEGEIVVSLADLVGEVAGNRTDARVVAVVVKRRCLVQKVRMELASKDERWRSLVAIGQRRSTKAGDTNVPAIGYLE